MKPRACMQMLVGLASKLWMVLVLVLLACACGSPSNTYRPPNLNELQAFARNHGITPIADSLLGDSVVLLYEQSASFGTYTLTARESDGTLVELDHVSAAKSDQPILVLGRLTGDQPFMAVVIQDPALLAETTAIEVSIDVLPGDAANVVYPNRTGKLPVAILSGPDFDATTVDESSLLFGLGEAGPTEAGIISDVDGLHGDDLTVRFNVEESGIFCNATEVSVVGQTTGGEAFSGTDMIDATQCETGGCHAY